MNWLKFGLSAPCLRRILGSSRDSALYQRQCSTATPPTESINDVYTDEPLNNTNESTDISENIKTDMNEEVEPEEFVLQEMTNDVMNNDSNCENHQEANNPKTSILETTTDEPVHPEPISDANEEPIVESIIEAPVIQETEILANDVLQTPIVESITPIIPVLSRRKTRIEAKSLYVFSVEEPDPQAGSTSKSSVATVLAALKLPNPHTNM